MATAHTPKQPLALFLQDGRTEAGADEAGRGCLAGPVVAAAVILPHDMNRELLSGLDDSKKLTERQREELRPVIMEAADAWAIGEASAEEIDKINILNAALLAMHRAIAQLKTVPQHLLIDGNKFVPYYTDFDTLDYAAKGTEAPLFHDETTLIRHTTVIKGDGKYLPIAAASVLAKTHRDHLMTQLAQEYPAYAWDVNKGYPTKAHYEAIKKYGLTPYHRKTFKLYKEG